MKVDGVIRPPRFRCQVSFGPTRGLPVRPQDRRFPRSFMTLDETSRVTET